MIGTSATLTTVPEMVAHSPSSGTTRESAMVFVCVGVDSAPSSRRARARCRRNAQETSRLETGYS